MLGRGKPNVGRFRNGFDGSKAWTPLDLGASILGWWSADRADLITLSGAQVTSWKDIIAGYDAVQAVSGSRPLYSATSFNNDAPGITFDGVDDELTRAGVPFPTSSSPCEMFALVDQTSLVADTTFRTILGYGGVFSVSQRMLRRGVVSGQNRVVGAYGDGASALTADVAADFSGRHVARAIFGATSVSVALDGVLGTATSVTPATGTTRMRIGAVANDVAGGFFKGVIRDLIVVSTLTVAQATLLDNYLLNKRTP